MFRAFKGYICLGDLNLVNRENCISDLLDSEVLNSELGILLGILSWGYFYVRIVYLYKSWGYFLPPKKCRFWV